MTLSQYRTCTIPAVLHAMLDSGRTTFTAHNVSGASASRLAAHVTAAPAFATAAGPNATTPSAVVLAAQRCYAVGQKVKVAGTGFSPLAPYDLSVDGVDFGQSVTSATGTLSASFTPGGLGAGQTQISDKLTASDGTSSASTTITVTRSTGALINSAYSSVHSLVPFKVWDFAPFGAPVTVYLHYVSPKGRSTHTVKLGTSTGECGTLTSKRVQLFPFAPSAGAWTLQFDTKSKYSAHPTGKVAGLRLSVG